MTKIAVTGGSGKAGRAVVHDLAEHGHQVLNIDLVASPESNHPEAAIPFLRADVTDFGQALEALSGGETLPGIEAVVHLAAIPSPAHATPDQVFALNITSTYAVFAAAQRLGLQRVVWASSETTLGLPFSDAAGLRARSTRPTCTRRPATRCRRSWGRNWRGSFTAGAGSRSSGCASPT